MRDKLNAAIDWCRLVGKAVWGFAMHNWFPLVIGIGLGLLV